MTVHLPRLKLIADARVDQGFGPGPASCPSGDPLRRPPELTAETRGRGHLAVLTPLSVGWKAHRALTTTKEE